MNTQNVRVNISQHMEHLTALVSNDTQQTTDLAVRSFAALSRQLNDKMLQIQQAEAEHREQQERRLQEYHHLHSKTKPMQQVLSNSLNDKQHKQHLLRAICLTILEYAASFLWSSASLKCERCTNKWQSNINSN